MVTTNSNFVILIFKLVHLVYELISLYHISLYTYAPKTMEKLNLL